MSESLSPWQKVLNDLQIRRYYSEKPAGLRWRSSTFYILSTFTAGIFTDMICYTVIVPLVPFLLQDRIGIPFEQVQTYTSIMLAVPPAAAVVFSPIMGVLADKLPNRQTPYLLGLFVLMASTVLLFLGTTLPVITAARVLQGASNAVVWTVGMAMCFETVGPKNLGRVMGTMFAFVSGGTLGGPVIGGLLYSKTGHLGVMTLCLALLTIDLIMRLFMIEKKTARHYGFEEPSKTGSPEAETTATDSSKKSKIPDEEQPLLKNANEPEPSIPEINQDDDDDDDEYKLSEKQPYLCRLIPILPCLTHPALLTSFLISIAQTALIGAIDATAVLHCHALFGFDAFQNGIMLLPLGIADMISGPIVGWATDKYGTKVVGVIVWLLIAPAFALLRVPQAGGLDQQILFGALLGVTGLGFAGVGAVATVEAGLVMDRFHRRNEEFFGANGPYAQLFGIHAAVSNLGLVIGPELAGELTLVIGYGNMNAVMAVIAGVMAVLTWLYIGGKPRLLKRKSPRSHVVV